MAAPGEAVAAVTLKLPAFWPADPELWFKQVESQFATRNITTDETKYHYLVAALTPETAAEVRDLLIAPPAADLYKTLKEEIVKRTTHSEQARLKQLLTCAELDGRKPTQLLRHMRQLVGSSTALVPNDLLKQLFLPRLPLQVQAVLAANESLTLDKQAELADKLLDVMGPTVAAVDSRSLSEVSDLKKEINEIKNMLRGRHSDKKAGGKRNRSKTPGPRSEDPEDICWFHAKFGSKANNCRQPCSFKKAGSSGN